MLIDWFTVAAQTVNFLLLIWLLHRFLYGPILRAMDRRETRIEARLKEALQAEQKARDEATEYQRLQRELEEGRVEQLREATEEAARHRKQLIEQGRTEALELAEAWKGAVIRDQRQFMADLKKRIGKEVLQIARKSLDDLTGSDLAAVLAERFAARFAALDQKHQASCAAAAEKSGVLVRSAVSLDQGLRDSLETSLRRVFGEDTVIDYRFAEDMPLGIELSLGGLKLSWGVDSQFAELERQLSLQFEEIGGAEQASGGPA